MIVKNFKKGKVILFGFNPFFNTAIHNIDWQEFWENLSHFNGVVTNQDIWRFQLPDSLIYTPKLLSRTCLTGNYLMWSLSNPRNFHIAQIFGTYKLNPKLNVLTNVYPVAKMNEIPFSIGKLTNRVYAPVFGDVDSR